MGFSARFRWYHPTESNSIVYLFNFSELKNSNKTHFQNSKCMNKNFEKVFYLPIIIDNTFHIIYGIRTLYYDLFFLSHWSLFTISAYRFTLSLLFFLYPFFLFMFMDEFRIFLYLGFTYTTYITVKSEFHII